MASSPLRQPNTTLFFQHPAKVFATAALLAPLDVGCSVLLRLTVASGRVPACCLEPTLRAEGVQILRRRPMGRNGMPHDAHSASPPVWEQAKNSWPASAPI